MNTLYLIPIIGYLLGSIPFGYLLVKTTEGTDIRRVGSGNIGATNVFRKNRWAGILTLLLDGGKGYLAVSIAAWIGGDAHWQSIAACSAIAGHLYTFWLRFKGGKGVATGCGAYLALSPVCVGITLVVFLLILALSRYISLASMLATAAFPLWLFLFNATPLVLFWAIAGSGIIVARHHENIRRLWAGTESKFALSSPR
jgi:acyl phosphate:glycerol-3-phosphate acyltransferase